MITARIATVVCTYRRPERLRRVVHEVFDQTGVADTVAVVVDDGSDDDGRTAQVLHDLRRELGDRLVTVSHPRNRGVAAARTTGAETAIALGAELVCFHDDDDLWRPNRLAAGAAPFQDPAVALTYAEQQRIDDSFLHTGRVNVVWQSRTRSYHRTVLDALFRGRLYLPFQTVMLRADLCRRLLPFMAVREAEDLDLAFRALGIINQDPSLRAVRLPLVLAYHVVSTDSLSGTDENNRIREQVHRDILARAVPRPVVNAMFGLSRRVVRPVGVHLGRARPAQMSPLELIHRQQGDAPAPRSTG